MNTTAHSDKSSIPDKNQPIVNDQPVTGTVAQQTPLPATNPSPYISPGPDIQKELARVNREIYERNVEMAIKNRTLSTLRKMYEIMNTTFGVEETAQKLIDAIVSELGFVKAFISLIIPEEKILKSIAISVSDENHQNILNSFGRPLKNFAVPLDDENNFCVKCAIQKHPRMTNNFTDILTPILDESSATKMAEMLNIRTTVVFPLSFAGEIMGTLSICLNKHIGDLSHAELDTIRELIEVISIAIEKAKIYHELQLANERLKQMDKLKDEFVSVASHELRTPMTAIKSYAWMVLNGKTQELNDKSKEYLKRVYISTERLINLVNDMLSVSRIESGRVQITVEPFNAADLIFEVITEFKPRSEEKSINLFSQLPSSSLMVSGDKSKIQEVLENLIGNALKFTPAQGTIAVTASDQGNMIKFCVKDSGKEISSDDIKKLFTKFGRLDSSYVSISENGGTGLGLYICKQYIELQKGKIWAESETGNGTAFYFTLPKA